MLLAVADWTSWTPSVQLGFASFAAGIFGTLTWIIVWMIRKLLEILKDNQSIVANNTQAIGQVCDVASDTKRLMGDIRDQLLQRPCLVHSSEHLHQDEHRSLTDSHKVV